MRKFFALCSILLAVAAANAQNADSFTSKFTTGVDIFNDLVQDSPVGVDFRTVNPGANVYLMYSQPIKESNISVAIGLGLGMHNLHSNSLLYDTASVSFMQPVPDKVNGSDFDYKTNKLQLTYLDIPAELRYKSDDGLRVAIGIKAGLLISAHTKYRGDNPDGGREIKIKESKLPNLEKWRFGPTFQIGYKWVNLTAFYSLSTVFDKSVGPEFYPVSIGIALRPF